MRLVAAQCVHESNSFSPVPTTLDDFSLQDFRRGDVTPAEALGRRSELAGFAAETAGMAGVETILTLGGGARSGGNMPANKLGS